MGFNTIIPSYKLKWISNFDIKKIIKIYLLIQKMIRIFIVFNKILLKVLL